ncbi:MAG: nitroreductase [Anaerolineae bacterium]|nr:nitroreductase [Anaerolineae bacterium]
MDAYKTITSLRAVRHFTNQPLSEETLTRILQAGRWTGSAKNVQPWHFIVVRKRETLERLVSCGRYASHLRGAAVTVVVVTEANSWAAFDAGRAAQNMMLAAWTEGVGSCIATLHDALCAQAVLGLPPERQVQAAISFGYPNPEASAIIEGQPSENILASLGRRSLGNLVHWEQF